MKSKSFPRRCVPGTLGGVLSAATEFPRFFARQAPRYVSSSPNAGIKDVLYNAPLADHALSANDDYLPLLVVRGYESVWACFQAGLPNVVGASGMNWACQANASKALRLASPNAGGLQNCAGLVPNTRGARGASWRLERVSVMRGTFVRPATRGAFARTWPRSLGLIGEASFRSRLARCVSERGELEAIGDRLKPLTF